jgi:hypothetical protein
MIADISRRIRRGIIMRISTLLLRVSIILLLAGLCLGIGMAMKQDFRLVGTHAHLNLVGFVVMFLAGLYYRIVPGAEMLGLAKAHAVLHIIAAIILPIGIAALTLYGPTYEIIAIIGSLIFLLAIILFAVVIYRTSGKIALS